MTCNLTEKLKFQEDPVLVIRDTELTVRSDAETVLTLFDALRETDEVSGAKAAAELLLSPEDREKLRALGLKLGDYLAVIQAAVQLALGGDPAGDENAPGE